jgi:hypothetical protein
MLCYIDYLVGRKQSMRKSTRAPVGGFTGYFEGGAGVEEDPEDRWDVR